MIDELDGATPDPPTPEQAGMLAVSRKIVADPVPQTNRLIVILAEMLKIIHNADESRAEATETD